MDGTLLGAGLATADRSPMLRRALKETCANTMTIEDYRHGSDNAVFHNAGIPTVWFHEYHASSGIAAIPLHSPEDALKIIDGERLASACAVIANCCMRLFANAASHRRKARQEPGKSSEDRRPMEYQSPPPDQIASRPAERS